MNQNPRWVARLAAVMTAAAILGGCQTPTRNIREPGSVIDPCADRLHDICGHLLLYYSLNKRLPRTLDDCRAHSDAAAVPPFTCPVSGKPYLYRPEGLALPGRTGRLVLYDATPAHAEMRWGILISQAHGGGPLTTRVLLIPEELVQAAERQENAGAENRAQD